MPLMARWHSLPFSADVSRRRRRFCACSRARAPRELPRDSLLLPTSPRLSRGWTCCEERPDNPKAGVLMGFVQKKKVRLLSRGCCSCTWVQYQGWHVSKLAQVPTQICCGWHRHNGTFGPKPHPPTTATLNGLVCRDGDKA